MRIGPTARCVITMAVLSLVTSAALTQSGQRTEDRSLRGSSAFQSNDGAGAGVGASESGLPNPSIPGSHFSHKGPGANFIKGGETTRTMNNPGVPGQVCPFRMTAQPLPPLPPGAVPVHTFIVWNYLLNGVPPAADTISVNGAPVTGVIWATGTPDLCWGKDGAVVYCFDTPGLPRAINSPSRKAAFRDFSRRKDISEAEARLEAADQVLAAAARQSKPEVDEQARWDHLLDVYLHDA